MPTSLSPLVLSPCRGFASPWILEPKATAGATEFKFQLWVTSPGSPRPPPSLFTLTLSQSAISSRRHGDGNCKTNFPRSCWWRSRFLAGKHGRSGDHPAQCRPVPAGSLSATFTTTSAPEVNAPHWVFIGAHYGTFNGAQARILRDRSRARASDVA